MQISENAKTTAAIIAVLLIPAVIFAYNAYEVAKERNEQISSASTSQIKMTEQSSTIAPEVEVKPEITGEQPQATPAVPEAEKNAEVVSSEQTKEASSISGQNQNTSLVIDQVKVLPNTSGIDTKLEADAL